MLEHAQPIFQRGCGLIPYRMRVALEGLVGWLEFLPISLF